MADIENARAMYDSYCEVKENSTSGHNFLKLRDIVIARKKPRTILVQSNTKLNDAGEFVRWTKTHTNRASA